MKWAITVLFLGLCPQKRTFAQDAYLCSICGEGKEVTNPGGVFTIPQNGDFTCEQLEAVAEQGGLTAQNCALLESVVEIPCGCAAITTVNATSMPTASPTVPSTNVPTFGPAPDCYDDLDDVYGREMSLSLQEIQTGRTYILCPGTVFFIGRLNYDTGGFENGFIPITPRPNVYYKCGENGSSANNCRIIDGTYQIFSFSDDPEHTNVTFQGLTIESAFDGGVFAASPGDLTFLDCIFKNHENIGPVIILFDSPLGRRLSGFGGVRFQKEGVKETDSNESDRRLQTLTTLTMTFKQCIFEGNKLVIPDANSGMITSLTEETSLIFEDVIFRNNDYGDVTLKPSTAAILSRGPLTLRNSCFIDNSFVADGSVIYIGTEGLDVSNNYVSPVDDQLFCSFVASYPNETAWMGGSDFTCTIADAETCLSDIPPVSPPSISPEDQPTRIPVPRVTLAPVTPPPSPIQPTPSGSPPTSFPIRATYMALISVFTLALLL